MLKHDISRCAGRSDLSPEATICPQRESCLRYRQIEIDRHVWKRGVASHIPYATHLCSGDRFEFRIQFDESEWHETMRKVSDDPVYHERMRNLERTKGSQ